MMKNILGILLLLMVPLLWAEEKTYGDVRVSEVSTIYDGDTFYVNINTWPPIVGSHIAVRVNGVDTPEIKGNCTQEIQLARKAKQFTVRFLRNARSIQLKNIMRDKYFRIDADVYADGKNLAKALIKSGFAVEYDGKKKRNWCGVKDVAVDSLVEKTIAPVEVSLRFDTGFVL